VWRHNLGLRGLTSLPVAFAASDPKSDPVLRPRTG
jgi:hypothetical protein